MLADSWGSWRIHRYLQNENVRQVFEQIWHYGPLTRNQLSQLTGLAIPTVSRITAELIKAGLVQELNSVESQRGRRPTLIAINPECGYIIGVDLGGTKLITLAINLEARVVARHETLLGPSMKGLEAIRQLLIQSIERVIAKSGKLRDQFIGVGAGLPGSIDHSSGRIIEASNLGIRNWPVREELEAALGLPVRIENDANAAALGELFFGAGRFQRNLAFVSLGTGIGLGLILNEVVFHGDLGQAGEFGHIPLVRDGPMCTCGNRGCLEALAGGWALPERYEEAKGQEPTSPESPRSAMEIFRLARSGDPIAQHVIAQAAEYLGMGIASLLNLLSLRLVVFGGGMIEGNPTFLQAIRKAAVRHLIPELRGQVRMVPSALGRNAGALGGAALILQQVFST
ncbi:ROK family transcriptional regulator [Thermoflexus sp.]|uniref:ROK family transcriptional regulator n=1 Tax=Thermoflexus sp. TaxID=1969742 RepID=UPI002ADDE264|nr:ROK family transcriptional regulator [Thermoflexus sp.]